MPRDIPVGNGTLLVTFDKGYRIRDLYYPNVGTENHTVGSPFRFGLRADGRLAWSDDGWDLRLRYLPETLVTDVRGAHKDLRLEFEIPRKVFAADFANPALELQRRVQGMIDFFDEGDQ